TAVKCMKLGAYDFLAKPINLDELVITVANALKSVELQQEVNTLRTQIEIRQSPDQLLGESAAMQELLRTLEQIAQHNLTVLIRGESGTGKELTARALHALSQRAAEPFISVDCATLPETLVESELFGYEKGAFTGAVSQKPGRFEQAGSGTLFLDEIGNLPVAVQVKLLRVLQERCVRRLGGKAEIPFHATLVSATNVDLEKNIKEGKFREDLYYRLNEFMVRLPPLRERRGDIPLLVKYFLDLFNRQFNKRVEGVSSEVMSLFTAYAWPGNVRELKNVMKRGVVLADTGIEKQHLPEGPWHQAPGGVAVVETVPFKAPEGMALKDLVKQETARMERQVILQTLEATRWNRSVTAKRLEIDYKTLYNKMKEYEIG
ncbi:MAG: sigma-54-dependent Fis family transcriptional regulator, partial [Candidatus Firestonebacteria bacterium]|nr:sigma-54-dependent Fis family transcriptional regulator [Candidatus Firestonebacteria bacterium]